MKKKLSVLLTLMLVFNVCCFLPVVNAADGDTIALNAIIRDFDPVNDERPELNHPDFENSAYFDTVATGAVKSVLGKDNTPVYADSGYSQKIITSADSFYHWFHDTSKNLNIPYKMVFTKSGDRYVFDSSSTGGFFPINNKGFGNYQDNKNYHFTLELHTKFEYRRGQVFEIAGDDDLWVFINGKLVADMGGIHETQTRNINLDSLGLTAGEVYGLDVFFAERHVVASNLKISTNLFMGSNRAPEADAGKNQSKNTDGTTVTVTLDGSDSEDPDGDELTYTWRNKEGNIIGRGVSPKVELPLGKNIITLTVSDGEMTDTDTVEVTVMTTKEAKPVADAGDDKTVRTDGSKATVTLDGSRSMDPNGDSLTYKWKNENGDTLSSKVSPSVQLPVGKNEITLTVSDGKNTDTDKVVITVTKNRAPTAHAGDDQRRDVDGSKVTVTLDGSRSTDPDGDSLTYKWTNEDNKVIGTTVRPNVELPVGENTIKLTVSDGVNTATDKVVIKVVRINGPVANAGDDQKKLTSGKYAEVTLDGSRSWDPNGDKLTYKWTDEDDNTVATVVKPTVKLPVGKNEITLTVSDGKYTDKDTVVITVEKTSAPVADAGDDQTKETSKSKVSVTLDGSDSKDPDGDKLTYKWTDEDGDTIATGVKPTVELPVGKHTIKLTVSDGVSTDTDTVVINIKKISSSSSDNQSNNRTPVANAGEDQVIDTDKSSVSVKLDASKSYDIDGDSLSYTWKDSSDNVIANGVKPSVTLEEGMHTLTLVVSDGSSSSVDTVTVIVGDDEISNNVEDVAVALTANKSKVEEDKEITLTIKYVNKSNIEVEDAYIELKVPNGVQVVDKGNGKQSGNKITWEIGDLDGKEKGQIKFKVKSDNLDKADVIKEFVVTILSDDSDLANTYDDSSKLGIMFYSNRYDNEHVRYILGYPDNTFKGERNITRAETAVVFARIMELKDLKLTNNTQFVDVKSDFWGREHIYKTVQVGLFKGVDSTHFNPDVPITRAELATVIANYLKVSRSSKQKPYEATFNDTKNHWASGNIEEIVRYNIVNGYEDGTFRPDKQITRQEAVVMINRMLYRGPLTKVANSFPDIKSGHWAFGDVEEAVRSHEFEMNSNEMEEMIRNINDSIW
ncbi:MAG: fibro-slime domain-containing protein [Clostridiaceae bacterium]|nr:fibro-slime domain-containing protein [Clostridiaceae bacterium]